MIKRVRTDQIRPGDVVTYRGRRRRIVHIVRRDGWAWSIAADETGWAIALGSDLIEVQRAAA
jgi:hypothetical protein